MASLSLQEQFAPHNKCFGCGPSNSLGLRIKSYVVGDSLVAHFKPQEHHQAFANVVNGGIVGALLDCHSNWCAAYFIMKEQKSNELPCTVTAKYSVTLLAPTPLNEELEIIATPTLVTEKKAQISAKILARGVCTATCEGLFVAVSPVHPAYHRW
jgi:acyl-coenzyme A thioesterase PaaI-like protein